MVKSCGEWIVTRNKESSNETDTVDHRIGGDDFLSFPERRNRLRTPRTTARRAPQAGEDRRQVRDPIQRAGRDAQHGRDGRIQGSLGSDPQEQSGSYESDGSVRDEPRIGGADHGVDPRSQHQPRRENDRSRRV